MSLRSSARLGSARRGVVAAGVAAGVLLVVSPGISGAAPSSYTWSGTDSAAGTNSNWSDSGNWTGNSAPASGSKVDLDFPFLNCGSSPCGNNGVNDLTGLKVDSLDMALTTEGSSPDYDLTGNGIKIGTLDITSATPTGLSGQSANVLVPLTLSGSEQWSIDAENNSNVNLGAVTGKSTDSLKVDLPVANGNNGGGFVGSPSYETGPLTFQGFVGDNYTYVTGSTGYNDQTGQPVKFDQTALFETGPVGSTAKAVTIKYAPLTISDTTVFFGDGYQPFGVGGYGIDSVAGSAKLDSGTNLNFNALDPGTAKKPQAGLTYPQLKATGNIHLGSANLGLFAACGQSLGTAYTLVSAASITGTFQNIPNGAIVQANTDSSPSCAGSGSPSFLRINYGPSTVTATVVAAPPGSALHVNSATPRLVPRLNGHRVQLVQEG